MAVMKINLWEDDITGDVFMAHLNERMDNGDIRESQNCLISVQYNEIDLGYTQYGFDQAFERDEANLYFERMKSFSGRTINDIVDQGVRSWHFYRKGIKGRLKKVFDTIDPNIARANPMIFHFALDPECQVIANRATGERNARIYFMVGYKGMIHPLFFDPYHELNPIVNVG